MLYNRGPAGILVDSLILSTRNEEMRRMWRELYIYLIVFLGAGALIVDVSARSGAPNIVLLVADDLGYGELSSYGGTEVSTPEIDRLAAGGQRWTRFYANASICSPTRASLMTGRYPHRAGIVRALVQPVAAGEGLASEEWTLAEALREAGYRTGLFGKWHLGSAPGQHPLDQGFDEFNGCLSGMIDHASHADLMGDVDWWHGRERSFEEGYVTQLITRHASNFIRRSARSSDPFFAFVSFTAPHSPYTAPGQEPIWKVGVKNKGDNVRDPDAMAGHATLVRELDRAVGELMKTLAETGAEKDTIVLFLSDNGAPGRYGGSGIHVGSNGPLRGQKFDIWEGGIRVPAIFRWPGRVSPGVIESAGITMDLMPTLIGMAGFRVPHPRAFDGVDLSPTLLRGLPVPERDLFWEMRPFAAIRSGGHKFVEVERFTGLQANASLFDLSNDEGEANDLTAMKPSLAASLRQRLEQWQRAVRQPSRRQFDPRDFGAAGDGRTLDTAAIQRAIDECARRGGGVVRLTPGVYASGTVELRSDVTLHLEKGATIRGSGDLSRYLRFDDTSSIVGVVLALNATNVVIEGGGTIDGNSESFAIDEVKFTENDKAALSHTRQGAIDYLQPPNPIVATPLRMKMRPSFMLTFAGCRNVRVEGVRLLNAPAFSVEILNCEEVVFKDCIVKGDMRLPNVDGIHIDDSSRVFISGCNIETPDDCIALTGYGSQGRWMLPAKAGVRPLSSGRTETIRVRDCILRSNSAAIRVGHLDNVIRDCEFRDITIYGSNRGIGLFVRGRTVVEDIAFRDMRIETGLHSGMWWGNGEAIHLSVGHGFDSTTLLGGMQRITFENITARCETGVLLWGDPSAPIKNVSFRNVLLKMVPGPFAESKGGNYDLRPMVEEGKRLFRHDIHAVHARHVRGLEIHGLRVSWPARAPALYGDTVVIEESADLRVDEIHDDAPERLSGRPPVRIQNSQNSQH